MKHLSVGLVGVLALVSLAGCGSSAATTSSYMAMLSGKNEVPANSSTATGMVTVTLNESTKQITVDGSYSGVTATAAHIHGPNGVKGTNVGVLCALAFDNTTNKVSAGACGARTFSDAEIADLKAGNLYVNIHSAANPGGEIRDQLVKQ